MNSNLIFETGSNINQGQAMKKKTILGMKPIKVLFAMEYFLQGVANPFQ